MNFVRSVKTHFERIEELLVKTIPGFFKKDHPDWDAVADRWQKTGDRQPGMNREQLEATIKKGNYIPDRPTKRTFPCES
jgi:hypothetical protein